MNTWPAYAQLVALFATSTIDHSNATTVRQIGKPEIAPIRPGHRLFYLCQAIVLLANAQNAVLCSGPPLQLIVSAWLIIITIIGHSSCTTTVELARNRIGHIRQLLLLLLKIFSGGR